MDASRRRVPAGAHYGVRDWLVQRVSALVLVAFLLVLAVALLLGGHLDYVTWAAVFAPLPMKLLTAVTFVALCYHAWIGVRDIWMDYVRHTGLRLALHSATIGWLLYCVLWALQILWSV